MTRDTLKPYDLHKIRHFTGVDHNESISIGPKGEAYTTSFHTHKVYRLHLETNTAEAFASTAPGTILGQVIDADGNLYGAVSDRGGQKSHVVRITSDGRQSVYSAGPDGKGFMSANTPSFDRFGNMYLSDTGSWSSAIDGHIYKIAPGGHAALWYDDVVDTPNGIAIDNDETFVYFVETWGHSISRIAINKDGSAGKCERVLHMPKHVPDGIAFDERGRIWIACHRPDAIYVFDVTAGRLELFAHDWQGEALRGPCHVAFAGADREILLASSLDRATVHRFDDPGVKGLRLNNPKL